MERKQNVLTRLEVMVGVILVFLLLINIFIVKFGFIREILPLMVYKSEKNILSDLLFLEGACILAIGAYVASGISILRMETPSSLYASPNGHSRYVKEVRKKQIAFGTILIIIGASLIGLSILIGSGIS